MKNPAVKIILRDWNGALAYVASAGVAGLLNTASVGMVKDQVTADTAANLDSILFALTGVSMLVIALQFVYARAIGEGNRAPMSQGLGLSVVASLVVAGIAILIVDSTFGFVLDPVCRCTCYEANTVFGPPFSGELDWGLIGQGTVWSVMVVVVAVFLEFIVAAHCLQNSSP